jgi:hypothetical protein
MACAWMVPVLFGRRVRGRSTTKHRFLGWRLKDIDILYTVVQCIFQDSWWFILVSIFFLFFLHLSFLFLEFCASLCKISEHLLQFFSPMTFYPYTFDYYFFYFGISYKIIDAFQFHLLLFF